MRIMEKSILGLRSAEEQELHSLERDIEQCSKELLKKKKQASGIKRRNQNYKKMKNKIEECAEDLAADKARVGLLEEFNKKNEHGLKKNKKELCKVMDGNNDIDCGGRKEEELETLSQKIVEITEEIKTKKKELGDAKISVSDNVKELVSLRSKLIKVMSKRRTDKCDQMKDFESSKKQYEGRVTEFKSKEEEFKDDQPSPTIDGRSLQLLPIEQIDELESRGNDILANLLASSSSDPSKYVLDIIQNPIIPLCKGDNAAIIDDFHIDLLEQLMRISPHVKPHVQEDAMNLALKILSRFWVFCYFCQFMGWFHLLMKMKF
ncbi:hypothetical protein MtrunA17_Chr4g0044221 [Medicago truncatula]|uniref:Frigida-LIKE protein n=1 Tax=Medicago truncatula TaxID=3880 RepID=A0A072UYH8_MEDTR|nr:frigida-LIKE protein [Medicago truncatula]RHN62143.1 hypothetical protein MtrunA17_Chr4g0044221 [Medicago truncatula]